MAVFAGFLLAARGTIHAASLFGVLAGTTCIIASGCVFNNYIDRHIDAKMARTKKRALVLGTIRSTQALTFAGALGILGFGILTTLTNNLTVLLGLIGFLDYVIVYSFWKRRSTYGTLIGSISGAIPPVAGYTAVTHRLDGAAVLLFLLLVCWQMSHFYAIAMMRLKDYTAAFIPVLPAKKGIKRTKQSIMFYMLGFIVICILFSLLGYTGIIFLLVELGVGGAWLLRSLRGFSSTDDSVWAQSMFRFSLIVLSVTCFMFSIESFLK